METFKESHGIRPPMLDMDFKQFAHTIQEGKKKKEGNKKNIYYDCTLDSLHSHKIVLIHIYIRNEIIVITIIYLLLFFPYFFFPLQTLNILN